MARLNTKNFALFLKQGDTPPTAPDGFIEVDEKLLITPSVTVEEYQRFSGRLGSNDSYADTCDVVVDGASVSHKMRYQNTAGTALDTIPEYAEILKIGGFTEAVDSTTPGEETVTYNWDTSKSPSLGSATYYLDGKKQTMTNTVALNLSFDFQIGKSAMLKADMSSFIDNKGIATSEANPSVTLSDEGCLMVGCADIYKEGTKTLTAKSITIDMGAEISKYYGMGLKEYQLTDFKPTISTEFSLDDTEYNDAINSLTDETYFDVVIELGTVNGNKVNGKTVTFTITNVKFSNYSDADDQDTLSRTHNLILTAKTEFSIKHGFYA